MYNLRRMTATSEVDLHVVLKRHGFSHRVMSRGLTAFVRRVKPNQNGGNDDLGPDESLRLVIMAQDKLRAPASLEEPVWVGCYSTYGGNLELQSDEYYDSLAQYLTTPE